MYMGEGVGACVFLCGCVVAACSVHPFVALELTGPTGGVQCIGNRACGASDLGCQTSLGRQRASNV